MSACDATLWFATSSGQTVTMMRSTGKNIRASSGEEKSLKAEKRESKRAPKMGVSGRSIFRLKKILDEKSRKSGLTKSH